MRLIFPKAAVVVLMIFTGACSNLTLPTAAEDTRNWSAERLYDEAQAAMRQLDYSRAIELLEQLEARYPFGSFAAQAQLDTAYVYYKYNEPEEALAAADRFIQLHPRHPNVDYAYYLKGLINYNLGIGFLERFLPTDSSQRDSGSTEDSYRNFEELITKYPDSKYAPDSRLRMVALRNNLAMYEIHVARYYIKRGAYVAAAARGVYVIENYQRTPAVPLALDVMYQAYNKLGMTELAADTKRVYDLNYPDGAPAPNGDREYSLAEKFWRFLRLDEE